MKYSSTVLLGLAIAIAATPQKAIAQWVTVARNGIKTTQVETSSYVRHGSGVVSYTSRGLIRDKNGTSMTVTNRTVSCDEQLFRTDSGMLITADRQVIPVSTIRHFIPIDVNSIAYWEAQEVCQLSEP